MLSPSTANFASLKVSTEPGSVSDLADFIFSRPKVFAITGAGISSASGIPTYRDDDGSWKSNTPIQHSEFMRSHSTRQRYWARSYSGWPVIQRSKPNDAHSALVELESLGYIQSLLTQNVDRLHQRANHRRVVDLHGRLDEVICMDCGAIVARSDIQEWLKVHNPQLRESVGVTRPDGDADVDDELIESVKVPSCGCCGGLLKPNVVFYGSSVDKALVSSIYTRLEAADSLLVVGSSLMVYSSFRFCKFAVEKEIPIVCINQGRTRADSIINIKVTQRCSDALSELVKLL